MAGNSLVASKFGMNHSSVNVFKFSLELFSGFLWQFFSFFFFFAKCYVVTNTNYTLYQY